MTTITKIQTQVAHIQLSVVCLCIGRSEFIYFHSICVCLCIFFDGQFISKIESNLNVHHTNKTYVEHKWFLVKSFTSRRWHKLILSVRDGRNSMVKIVTQHQLYIRYNMFNASISWFPCHAFYSSHPFNNSIEEKKRKYFIYTRYPYTFIQHSDIAQLHTKRGILKSIP